MYDQRPIRREGCFWRKHGKSKGKGKTEKRKSQSKLEKEKRNTCIPPRLPLENERAPHPFHPAHHHQALIILLLKSIKHACHVTASKGVGSSHTLPGLLQSTLPEVSAEEEGRTRRRRRKKKRESE